MASWASLRSAILVILVEKQEGRREFFEPQFLRTTRYLPAQKGKWLMGE